MNSRSLYGFPLLFGRLFFFPKNVTLTQRMSGKVGKPYQLVVIFKIHRQKTPSNQGFTANTKTRGLFSWSTHPHLKCWPSLDLMNTAYVLYLGGKEQLFCKLSSAHFPHWSSHYPDSSSYSRRSSSPVL